MPTSNCVWQIKLFLSVIDETIHLRNDLDMNETAMVNPKFHAIRETEPLPTPSYRIIQKNSYMITPNEFVVSRRLALIVKELTERYLDFHNASTHAECVCVCVWFFKEYRSINWKIGMITETENFFYNLIGWTH